MGLRHHTKNLIVHNDSRIITIGFEEGDSEIQIIGTYAIPEFGAIIVIVMTSSNDVCNFIVKK